VLQNPEAAAKLKSDGGDVMGGTPEAFAALLKADIPRWGRIVKESGATID
jgi:tripartite-type tricarboxylate transporter receptor subunit TctC